MAAKTTNRRKVLLVLLVIAGMGSGYAIGLKVGKADAASQAMGAFIFKLGVSVGASMKGGSF